MKTKEEIKRWLLENCLDEKGKLDLSGLDFSDLDADVDLSGMKVNGDLHQDRQEVDGDLFQGEQKVEGNIDQSTHEVNGDLFQCEQKVKGMLIQSHQEVGEVLDQRFQKVKGEIYLDAVVPHALSECKSLIDSNLELLRAKAKAEADFKYDAMYAEFESECSYRQGRETAFEEAVTMAEQTARAMERWIEFAKKKEKSKC